jgi:hypothetical protein
MSSSPFTIIAYLSSFGISGKAFSFNDPSNTSSYKILSIPGKSSNLRIDQFAKGEEKKDWTAFYDNGAVTDYFKEFDGSNLFNFGPGKGFWVLSKNTISLSGQVSSVSLANDGSYSFQIHPGWNIISNPFAVPINWSSVIKANNFFYNQVIYTWNSSGWSTSQKMDPFEGYYFNSIASANNDLKIPYKPVSVIMKEISPLEITTPNENFINIDLMEEDQRKSHVTIGININSFDDFDQFDYMAPPGDFQNADLRIINKKLSVNWKELFVEFRKQIGEGQRFELKYKNNTGKSLTLSVLGTENFEGQEIYLLDCRLNQLHNLKIEKIILLPAFVAKGTFEILIGNNNYIDKTKRELVPLEFSLYQNYPNPFNPVTTIKYSIPEDAFISLQIFVITGKKIRNLENSYKEAGYHEAEFNASDVASGLYLYKLEARSKDGRIYSDSKKMSLVK